MYKAYEIINTTNHVFTYVFVKEGLNFDANDQYYDASYLKDINECEVSLIIRGYNLLEEVVSDFGPSYIQINTQEELSQFFEYMGIK